MSFRIWKTTQNQPYFAVVAQAASEMAMNTRRSSTRGSRR